MDLTQKFQWGVCGDSQTVRSSFRICHDTTETRFYPVLMSGQSRQMLWVRNSGTTPLVLCIQPWANEILVEPGKAYLAVFDGPEGKFPVVEWGMGKIILCGWSGSVVQVLLDETVVLSCAIPVPPVPEGYW